ncbi:AbrB/MazE/SpoVT family DNA-binding domain-containing protein [Fictibacillus terranigra]|uniref:AbrB/MazE/SpoVT family DNA-binding domain-containing protein n=1 Tax=Fictibacillus terranigra TaxID=3058424 RepID=A0ABT8ECE2_9BACL|nr:AbrB/MazE/SpoVT family DNA-binding domain-containing protein [Fictibacillus sp. CENA-BCM004]MDN4075514.1 AbrB/MazE/SpoVT family DNA-binding domain-containing protein [Fictibacillus sp. CENA-BCM004]
MKSTGIVRKVDELGRIVIPIELRRVFEIDIRDPIEIFVDDNKIILQKYMAHNACVITGEITSENRTYGDGKFVLSPEGVEILLQELEEAK